MSSLDVLAAQLAGFDDAALLGFLRSRSDLGASNTSSFQALAARASARASLHQALELLTLPELNLLTASVLLGQAPAARLSAAVSAPSQAAILPAIERLLALALLVTDNQGKHDAGTGTYSAIPALREVLGLYPAGLGRSWSEFGVSAGQSGVASELLKNLDALPQPAFALLEKLTWNPVGQWGNGADGDSYSEAAQWLIGNNLLQLIDGHRVELPREVALAMRGGRVFDSWQATPPTSQGLTLIRQSVSANAAEEAVASSLRTIASLLKAVGESPLPTLRGGGVGVRVLSKLSKSLGLADPELIFFLELAALSHLIALNPDTSHWQVTSSQWQSLDRPSQWLWLVNAWLTAQSMPSLAGADGVNVLGVGTHRPGVQRARAAALRALQEINAQAPEDSLSVPSQEFLGRVFAWYAPRLATGFAPSVGSILNEAALLGLSGAGALSRVAQEVIDENWDRAKDLLSAQLPSAIDKIILQDDLTAIAPGYLSEPFSAELLVMSAAEGQGTASIYRFSASSITNALDTGKSPQEILDFLHANSLTPLPQALDYLVREAASRHGRLVVGQAGTFVTAATPALMAEFMLSPQAAQLAFVQLSETVAVSLANAATSAQSLRQHGVTFTPAPGSLAPTNAKANGRRRTSPGAKPTVSAPADLAWLHQDPVVEKAQETLEFLRGSSGGGDQGSAWESEAAVTLETLRRGARNKSLLAIEIVDANGASEYAAVRALGLESGMLRFSETSGAVSVLPLHRIVAAKLVEETHD